MQNVFSVAVGAELLNNLLRGAKLVFDNAEELYNEAFILRRSRAFSRALFLHQISMEECAKIEMLGATAASLLMGETIDLKKVAGVFQSHSLKNKANAYFLKASARERVATQKGDIKAALEVFGYTQDQFHLRSNSEKNAALYVDLVDEEFRSPRSRITPKMVVRIGKLNARYLQMAQSNVRLLDKLSGRSEKYCRLFRWSKRRLHKLASELPGKPTEALNLFLHEMFENTCKLEKTYGVSG